MSVDDYTNCLRTEERLDEEAVRFIIQIYELGGEEAIKAAKRGWDSLPDWVKSWLQKAAPAAAGKLLTRVVGEAVGAVLLAMVAGLGLAAVALALAAAEGCLPRLAQ